MMRFGGRRRRNMAVNAEISITNLVDVAFVLLIIFMITAPILQGGIEVQLPEADSRPLEASEAVTVSVAKDGSVFIEKAKVSMQEFEGVMRTYVGPDAKRPVILRGDRATAYGGVAEVFGVLARMGADVSIAIEPAPQRR